MKNLQIVFCAALILISASCTCHVEQCNNTQPIKIEFSGYAKNEMQITVHHFEKGSNFGNLSSEESYNLIFWDMVDGKVFWEFSPNTIDNREVDEFDYKFFVASDSSTLELTNLERDMVEVKDCNSGIFSRRSSPLYSGGCPLKSIKADGHKVVVRTDGVLAWTK